MGHPVTNIWLKTINCLYLPSSFCFFPEIQPKRQMLFIPNTQTEPGFALVLEWSTSCTRTDGYCSEAACTGWQAFPLKWSVELTRKETGVYNINVEGKPDSYVSSHWKMMFMAARFTLKSISSHPSALDVCISSDVHQTIGLMQLTSLWWSIGVWIELESVNISIIFVTDIIIVTSGWHSPLSFLRQIPTDWLQIMEELYEFVISSSPLSPKARCVVLFLIQCCKCCKNMSSL